MARHYYLCIRLDSANLKNVKQGRKAQSPMVVFSINPGDKRVLSKPARNGGMNPRWGQYYVLLCEECHYKIATLTMLLYDVGKKYDKFLGMVLNISVSNLTPGPQPFLVLNESGMPAGDLNLIVRVVPPPPVQRSIKVFVHHAKGLKNVKPFWKRFSPSTLCVRKMRSYVVAESNLKNEPQGVSRVAGKGGKDPEFKFEWTFKCQERLLEQDVVVLKIELYHRHKAEINCGSSDSDRAKDIIIGTVEDIKVSKMMAGGPNVYRVRTLKGKDGGTLSLSVTLGELEQHEQELETPSPYSPWEPRLKRGRPGASNCFGRVVPLVSMIPAVASVVGLAIA